MRVKVERDNLAIIGQFDLRRKLLNRVEPNIQVKVELVDKFIRYAFMVLEELDIKFDLNLLAHLE